jgi:hypothetical protein
MTHISHLTNIPTANTVMVTPNLGGKHSNVGITVAANTFTDVVGNTNTTIAKTVVA